MRSSSLMAVLVGYFSLHWLSSYQNYNQLASKPQIQFWLFIQNQGNIFGIGDGFFSYWIGNLGNFNHFWVVAGRHEPKSSTSREPTRVLSQKYISKPKMADNGKGWSVKPQNRKFWSFLEPSPVDLVVMMQVSLPLTMCTLAARLIALTFILAFQVNEQSFW